MKFLCDEMLKRLGQWLRAAGYDVLMLPDGTSDRELIQKALEEHRVLVTRDREMAALANTRVKVTTLDCADLRDCVRALGRQLAIDWLHAPFSRCMNCNTPLVDASDEQRRHVPRDALLRATEVRYCPMCKQLFWDGSHVARMRERLEDWASKSE